MIHPRVPRLVVIAIAVTLVLVPALTLAQHRGHERRGSHGDPGHDKGRMADRLFDKLDLTDDQRRQVEGIFERHHEQAGELRERMESARRAVATQIHAAEFNEQAVRDAAAALAPIEADLAVSRARSLQEIRQVLTPEQAAQVEEMMVRRHGGPEGHDDHGGPGPGMHPRGPRGGGRQGH